MKNYQFLFLFIALMMICSLSNAQSNADFQGSWTGTDNAGNSIELQLNSTMTCVLKINGTAAYNITAYRLYYGKSIADPGLQAPKRIIKFYTNSNAPVSTTSNTVLTAVTSVTTYDGNLEITDLNAFKAMNLEFSTGGSAATHVKYSLSK
jgi:hypothetical protein